MNGATATEVKHVHAVVTAYNSAKIKDVVVDWSE